MKVLVVRMYKQNSGLAEDVTTNKDTLHNILRVAGFKTVLESDKLFSMMDPVRGILIVANIEDHQCVTT